MNAFGAGGTVVLAPASSSDDLRPPALCVHGDEVAVVWNQTGADTLLFQRFRAGDGAPVDAAPKSLGNMTLSSSHPFIVHNGSHYAVVWARQEDADHKLRIRLVDDSGEPEGARPRTLAAQTAAIRDPHLAWDSRRGRFLVVWAGSDAHPDGDLRYVFADPAGSPSARRIPHRRCPLQTSCAGRTSPRTRTPGTSCCGKTTPKAAVTTSI